MAYTMTHILAAEKLLHEFGKETDYSTYILGSIAPDAVHACADFSKELKERSHLFPEGLRWGKVEGEADAQKWLANIKSYYISNRDQHDASFLKGYMVHLLTDVYCSVHFYGPFVQSIRHGHHYEEKFAQYKKESYCVNYYFFLQFSQDKSLYHILHKGKAETLGHVLQKEILESRIEQLFGFEFKPWDISHIADHEMCRIEDMEHLIQNACTFVKELSWI